MIVRLPHPAGFRLLNGSHIPHIAVSMMGPPAFIDHPVSYCDDLVNEQIPASFRDYNKD